ncbi:hypothetical protein V8F20_009605 [Naviculisporaceae sp. PSN 640]
MCGYDVKAGADRGRRRRLGESRVFLTNRQNRYRVLCMYLLPIVYPAITWYGICSLRKTRSLSSCHYVMRAVKLCILLCVCLRGWRHLGTCYLAPCRSESRMC